MTKCRVERCGRELPQQRPNEGERLGRAVQAVHAGVFPLDRDGAGIADRVEGPEGVLPGHVAVVNMFNPSIVVIGGSIARAGEHLLAGVREVVYRRSIPLATQLLTIVPTQAGETAGVLGAAIMVAQHVLAPAHVDALTARA